jgi:hypothetical protein
MRIMKSVLAVVLILIVLVLTGCYMDVPQSEGSVSINVQPRGDLGDSGEGYYLVVKVFKESVIDPLISSTNSEVAYTGGIYYNPVVPLVEIVYNPALLPTPVGIGADYLGIQPPPDGSFTIPVLASPSRYRLLVEQYEYSSGIPYLFNAGISDPFIVEAGTDTTVDVELIDYNFFLEPQ